jgi:regulatory protein
LSEDAYELALRALSRKERTESELRSWLAERDVGEAEIAEVLELLAEAGAVDDASFARRYAEDKRTLAGWGPERIGSALEARGVAREHIDAALVGEDEGRQLERAISLLDEREMRCISEAGRERALRLLVRRGYSLEIGYEAVRAAERASREAA